ncbi:MAG: hypothetical protein FWH35_00795 [Treponema sp.]|nr:hypothetical protein [Treponema sp.]
MANFDDFYNSRDILSEILQKDLIGPVYEDEVLSESPLQYYIMGKLYPKKQNSNADEISVSENDNDSILDMAQTPLLENESSSFDSAISLSNVQNPSSMGYTLAIKSLIQDIIINLSYAFYKPSEYENAIENNINVSKWDGEKEKPDILWVRKGYTLRKKINFEHSNIIEEIFENGIKLQIVKQKYSQNKETILTITILNENIYDPNNYTNNAGNTAFQVNAKITGEKDNFIFHTLNDSSEICDELDLLYADYKCYAQGHGCSVQWDTENTEPLWISSSCLPSYELRQMKAREFPRLKILDIEYLSKEDPAVIIAELKKFNNFYSDWINDIRKEANALIDSRRQIAEVNIKKCRDVYMQINKAIESLNNSISSDGKAYRAFQLANEAMYLQRVQTIKKNKKGQYNPETDKILWYPFQLSYFLHEIISFVEPEGTERKNVDLLWFPTGGGKTEAYLGIAAFVIFYRRLLNENNDGVTVIMRYTLRLLTLQQFERASMLIMACELLRKKYRIGEKEISIGLWVGNKLTPNALSKAKTNINKLQNGSMREEEDENPCQIKECYWCGTSISPVNYKVREEISRMVISCHNKECDFNSFPEGLPVHIIDDAIYKYLPSFIVATIDKFAQIPLSDKPASLFGISSGKKPPELIIQDELHLISGPLGTMTGIYEVAVTNFCEYQNIPVKIIASTATIKNADKQILSLYGRNYTQFPPQGISINDSFFAQVSERNEKPARQYFGVMGTGTTATTTLIRVNAALLFASRFLETMKCSDNVIDNYWTIVGYFNSLRELGGASTQIVDDVQSRFGYLAKSKFSGLYPGVSVEKYDHKQELTSRMNNSDLSEIIQKKLKKSYSGGNHTDVYDFVIASNMISVGIDINRLGLMVVAGQPKTNAEYIQTTSRIGRHNPGLVVTVFNGSRSRDRSHYEQFQKYHSALYRYVEATSITPFSDRARDRGLHALFVAFCRYKLRNMLGNEKAVNFHKDDPEVGDIINDLVRYVKKADPLIDSDELKQEIMGIASEWDSRTDGGLAYKHYYNNGKVKDLLKNDISKDKFRTMNSLRNVDAESGIYLLGGE